MGGGGRAIGARRKDTVATVGAAQSRPAPSTSFRPASTSHWTPARPTTLSARRWSRTSSARCAPWRRGAVSASHSSPSWIPPATPMHAGLIDALTTSVAGLGIPPVKLASGAGHDAVAMATLCPPRCCSCAAKADQPQSRRIDHGGGCRCGGPGAGRRDHAARRFDAAAQEGGL
jgi:hypothetical protein